MVNANVSKELQQRWKDRIAWVQSTNFDLHESEELKSKKIKRLRTDYGFFVAHCFPHLAKKKTAKFQKETADIIKKGKDIRALLEWARGHAKSSHASLFIPLWLLFQEEPEIHFMVLVSKSQDAAIRLLSDLQAELQYNEILIGLFGRQFVEGNWADGEFVTTGGCMFIALGRGQSPRGLKNRGNRPDYIVIDDIDDDELVRNPKRVGEVLEWILTALFGAMEGGRGRFIFIGNRIGKDSVLSRFAALKGIHHRTVNMLDKNGKPSWPENYTMQEVANIKLLIGERRFQKEYMNNPINEGTVFLKKHIKYGKMLDLKHYRTLVCYTDPSFKDSSSADFKATMLLGKTKEGEYHLIKAFAAQTSVSAMVGWHYQIDAFVNGRVPVMYFIESNFLQDLLLDEFKKAGADTGKKILTKDSSYNNPEYRGNRVDSFQIPIRGDNRKKPDKFARIEAMQPLFERRFIVFNEDEQESEGMQVLEEQLLMFEKGSRTHDDAPDALEGGIFLLNQRSRSSNATYAVGKRESRKY